MIDLSPVTSFTEVADNDEEDGFIISSCVYKEDSLDHAIHSTKETQRVTQRKKKQNVSSTHVCSKATTHNRLTNRFL